MEMVHYSECLLEGSSCRVDADGLLGGYMGIYIGIFIYTLICVTLFVTVVDLLLDNMYFLFIIVIP